MGVGTARRHNIWRALWYKALSQASGYGERMCQGVNETELEVAAAPESLVAMNVQSCGCSNLLRRPARFFNWLRVSDRVKVLVPSLTPRLSWSWPHRIPGTLVVQDPRTHLFHLLGKRGSPQLGTWPTKAPSSQGWRQQEPSATCSHAAQALWMKRFFQMSKRNLVSHRLWLQSPPATCSSGIRPSPPLLPSSEAGEEQREAATISAAFLDTFEKSIVF